MPTFLRSPRPARRLPRRNRGVIFSSTIKTVVGTAVGFATVSGVGASIATSTGTAAGSATTAAAGVGILTSAGTSAGTATAAAVGQAFTTTTGTAAGTAIVVGVSENKQITSSLILQKPIDYVLAGQQNMTRGGRAAGRALRHTFAE